MSDIWDPYRGEAFVHPSLSGGQIDTDTLPDLPKELPFSNEEYQKRLQLVRQGMKERNLEVLLVHYPPSVFYLSGHQSMAMYSFECVILPLNDDPTLIVHPPEIGGALLHSWFPRLFGYNPNKSRERFLAELLSEQGLDKTRIGVEMQNLAFSIERYNDLRIELPNADIVDGSGIMENVKACKSPKEIEYLREAAKMTNLGMKAALKTVSDGKMDNDVASEASLAMLQAGSEYFCIGPIVTSGQRSGILHSTHKRVRLNRGDAVLIEMGGCYNRYTTPLMRSVSIGKPNSEVEKLTDACLTAIDNVISTLRPGITADEVARAGWEGLSKAGPEVVSHGNFGYAVGAGFPPAWADSTGIIELGVQTKLKPGMVFHHPVALRSFGKFSVAFSETSVITDDGCEVLTGIDRELFIK